MMYIISKVYVSVTRLLHRKTVKKYKALSDKELEDSLINGIHGSELTFVKSTMFHPMCKETHYQCKEANIRVRIDYPWIGGSYTFIYVNGKDYSYTMNDTFDYRRVVDTIRTGRDNGSTSRTRANLYDC